MLTSEAERRRRSRERKRAREREAEKQALIDHTACERQAAWQEKGRPDVTDYATTRLGWLFDGVRADRRQAYAYGEREGSAYRGWTSQLRRF